MTDSAAGASPPHTNAGRTALFGVGLMAAGALLIPGIDAIAKTLGAGDPSLPPAQIAFVRFAAQILLVGPLALALGGWAALRPTRPLLMALRGVLIALATIFFFAALNVMPMAETVAIFFVEPLILTVLSAVLLGERIGWRRVTAVTVGLAGAMLIVRPSFADAGWGALLPLGAAVCFAFYLLLTKVLAHENSLALQFWAAAAGFGSLAAALGVGMGLGALDVAPGLTAGLTPVWPTAAQWGLLGLLGLVATIGHLLVTLAFRYAAASTLAPLQYLEIVSATALGWLVFGDFPDPSTPGGLATWAGVTLIVGSGLFVFWRERRSGAQPRPEDSR